MGSTLRMEVMYLLSFCVGDWFRSPCWAKDWVSVGVQMLCEFYNVDTTSTCEMKFALNLKLGNAKMTLSKVEVIKLNDLCIFSRLFGKKKQEMVYVSNSN